MKTITLIFLFLQFALFGLFAQVKLTYETHAMRDGDLLLLKNLKTEGLVWDRQAGANRVWDFSNLEVIGERSVFYNATPGANSTLGRAFANEQDDNTTVFHHISPNARLYTGLINDRAKIEFHEPIRERTFPFGFGDEIRGRMIGSYTTLRTGAVEDIRGYYSVRADAWGTLILPNGVVLENVLRVVYVKDYQQLHFGHLFHITVSRYLFYAAESRYPVMQIREAMIDSEFCGVNIAYQAVFNDTVRPALPEVQERETMALNRFTYTFYPNPFEANITLNYELNFDANVRIALLDLSGRELKVLIDSNHKQGSYSITRDFSNLTIGAYLLRMNVGDREYVKTIIKKR